MRMRMSFQCFLPRIEAFFGPGMQGDLGKEISVGSFGLQRKTQTLQLSTQGLFDPAPSDLSSFIRLLCRIGPSSGFRLLSRLFSQLGMPFPGLFTWCVLGDTSFCFVLSARKTLTQALGPSSGTCTCGVHFGQYSYTWLLTFLSLICNSLTFSLLLAFCVVPVLYLKSFFMSFGYINGDK